MNGKGFVVGTFFGIQLRIDYSWFIIFVLVVWVVITSYIPAYTKSLSSLALIGAGVLITIIFFISLVAHEYAHSIVANRRGVRIKRITLFLLGGASELQQDPDNPKTEFLMTIAGPLTSLVIAGIFAGIWLLAKQAKFTAVEVICEPVAVLNLVVSVFNILPAFPLDGGRILRSILWMIRKDYTSATRSATNVGVAFAYAMIGIGVLAILTGGFLGGLWLGIIGFFLLQSARLSYAQSLAQNILAKVKIADIYNDAFVVVPLGISVDTFLSDYVLRFKQYNFLVTDQAKNPVGVIEMGKITNHLKQEGAEPIDKFVQPITKRLILKPTDLASKALQLMQSQKLRIVPVMTGKRLVGVVTQRYLEDYVAIHQMQYSQSSTE